MSTIDTILARVGAHYGVTVHVLKSRARQNHVAHPRMIVCWLGVQLGFTSVEVARAVNRDRSNVTNALHKIDSWRRSDRRFRARFLPLFNRLKKTFPALKGI